MLRRECVGAGTVYGQLGHRAGRVVMIKVHDVATTNINVADTVVTVFLLAIALHSSLYGIGAVYVCKKFKHSRLCVGLARSTDARDRGREHVCAMFMHSISNACGQ